MRILAISGSLRFGSYNTALARAAATLAPSHVDVELFDALADVPAYDPTRDGDDPPVAVGHLRDAISNADALLLVTPEYNGSIPGALKNAVDWASRPHRTSALWGKTTAVAGASPTAYGAIWAQQDLRRVLGIAGARVIEGEVSVPEAHTVFADDGTLIDERVAARLAGHLELLARETAPTLVGV